MAEVIDLITFLNNAYSSSKTRELLFGSENIAYRHIKGAAPILRIVYIGALLIFLKWKKLPRRERIKYNSKNYLRVEELFLNLYGNEQFNIDSAIYILFEGQKDVIRQKEKSFFYGLIDENIYCEYGKIYGVLDEWIKTTNHVIKSYSEEYVQKLFIDLVNNLRVLRDYHL